MSNPPPWDPFPAPPRRPRPSAWWFAVGGALLVLAVVAGVGLFVWTLVGFTRTDTAVPVDGTAHPVEVPADRDRMLWYDESRVRPECTVRDTQSGEDVALGPVSGSFTRGEGATTWRAFGRFDPGSGTLELTCRSSAGDAGQVEVGPAPRVGAMVGGIVATLVVPLVLGGIGLLVLLVTTVRFITGDPRPRRPA